MPSLPALANATLDPASPEQVRAALNALFNQFPSHDGMDPGSKVAGYLLALGTEPKWAVERAVKRFLAGEVSSHDGKFLPSSAELARVAREESDFVRRCREREARMGTPVIEDQRSQDPAARARIAAGFERLSAKLAGVDLPDSAA